MTTPNPQNANWPLIYDQIAVNVGGNDTSMPLVWTDITDRVVQRSIGVGRADSISRTEAAEVTYLLRDRDDVFNPLNPSGPHYGQLLPNRRIRTLVMYTNPTSGLAGNIYNASQLRDDFTSYAAASSFEDGTTGGWTAGGTNPPTLANSTTHAFDGTHALQLTLPTAAGGLAVTNAQMPVPRKFWGLAIGQTYSVAVRVWLNAGVTAAVNLAVGGSPTLTGSSLLSTTTTGGWVKLFATFVCNDASANVPIVYVTGATTSGQLVWLDAAQIEFGATSGAYSTTGPAVVPLFAGYVERWPTSWTHQGLFSWAELGCTDDLGTFGLSVFVDPVYHQALLDGPTALYPLTESAGTTAGNAAVTQQPPLAQTLIGGGGAGTLTFAADAGPTGVDRQVLQLAGNTSAGVYLSSGTLATPIGGGSGLTLYCWFKVPSAPSSIVTLCALWNGPNDYLTLGVGADGGIRTYIRPPGSTVETLSPTGAFNVADDAWHFAAVLVSCSGTTYTVTTSIDGGSFSPTVISGVTNPAGASIVGPYATLTAGAEPKGRLFNGSLCYVGALPNTTGDLVDVHTAGANGFAGEHVGTRIARLDQWFQHSLALSGTTSVTMQGAQVHNGKTVQEILGDITDTEGGTLFSLFGLLTLQTRNARQLMSNPVAIFGENAAGGEVPYESDFGYSLDLDSVYNDVSIEQNGGVTVRVVDAASQAAYYPRALSLTVYSDQPADATDHANALLSSLKTPLERIGTLTVQAGNRGTGAWLAVLNAYRQARLIQVVRRLPSGATLTGLYVTDKVTHTIGPGPTWQVAIQASPQVMQSLIIGDATRGLLGSAVLGW